MPSQLDWSAYETSDPLAFGDPFGAPTPPSSPDSGFANALATCHGKQACLRTDQEVMCPSFRLTGEARHSPFHRAQVLRKALTADTGDGSAFDTETVRSALELCIGCKGCKRECPNGMDIALAATEARARAHALTGKRALRERLFTDLPQRAPLLRRLRPIIRFIDRVPLLGPRVKSALGLSPHRRLPVPARRSFHDLRRLTSYGSGDCGDVVLLADTFSNHFEPGIADAALQLLTGLGYGVHLPRGALDEAPLCCGRTWLSQGHVDEARRHAARLVDTLAPYVDAGMPIVGLEPSCLLMLRDEYRALGLGGKVTGLAKAAKLFEEFMVEAAARAPDSLTLSPLPDRPVLFHGHCHQKAFGTTAAMGQLLERIPGARVSQIRAGCCGMAGAFGYEKEHHELSVRMAEETLLPAVRNAPPDALIVANGTSCRQQILDGTGRRPLHLAQVLAMQFLPSGQVPEAETQPAT